jgi:SET domain-containing protein
MYGENEVEMHIGRSEIYVGLTAGRGRGVFAARAYEPGEPIEVCPVIVCGAAEAAALLDRTELFNYYFAWGEGDEGCAIALGFGSLYNHSYQPNADHVRNFAARTITVTACRPIGAGEEITINYMGAVDCADPVWFETKEK